MKYRIKEYNVDGSKAFRTEFYGQKSSGEEYWFTIGGYLLTMEAAMNSITSHKLLYGNKEYPITIHEVS